jgi:hypothetical protein
MNNVNNSEYYKQKYLKYKFKYLKLQKGGVIKLGTEECPKKIGLLDKFILKRPFKDPLEYLGKYDCNYNMLLGLFKYNEIKASIKKNLSESYDEKNTIKQLLMKGFPVKIFVETFRGTGFKIHYFINLLTHNDILELDFITVKQLILNGYKIEIETLKKLEEKKFSVSNIDDINDIEKMNKLLNNIGYYLDEKGMLQKLTIIKLTELFPLITVSRLIKYGFTNRQIIDTKLFHPYQLLNIDFELRRPSDETDKFKLIVEMFLDDKIENASLLQSIFSIKDFKFYFDLFSYLEEDNFNRNHTLKDNLKSKYNLQDDFFEYSSKKLREYNVKKQRMERVAPWNLSLGQFSFSNDEIQKIMYEKLLEPNDETVRLKNIGTALEFKNAEFKLGEIKDEFYVYELLAAGFTSDELLEAGFTPKIIKFGEKTIENEKKEKQRREEIDKDPVNRKRVNDLTGNLWDHYGV